MRAERTVVPDHTAWIETAASIVREASASACQDRGRFSLVLSGGTTPTALYDHLAQPDRAETIDWSVTSVFFGDERCVPPGDAASNYTMASRALLDHVGIPSSQVHRIEGELSPADAVARYRSLLAGPGLDHDDDGVPVFDLVLLGLGANAHTASLFPGLSWRARPTELIIDEFVEVEQQWRITMTPRVLCAARQRVFLVEGSAKAAAVATVLTEPYQPVVAPAQAIVEGAPSLWLLDDAAASGLSR